MAFVNYPQRIKTLFNEYKMFIDLKKKVQEPFEKDFARFKKLQISRAVTNLYYCGCSIENYAKTILTRIFYCIAAAIKWRPSDRYSYYKYRTYVAEREWFDFSINRENCNIIVTWKLFKTDGTIDKEEDMEFAVDDLYKIPQALIDKFGEKGNITEFFKKKVRKI